LALKNQGAPIAFAIPNPAFALPWGAAIVSNSRRPNAAMVFMDFMTSLDGQKTITGNGTHGVSALDFPQSVALDQLKLLDFARFTPDVIEGWSKKVEGALLH
jgi:ABC-type Fe3+ transport system substrate-binding protein